MENAIHRFLKDEHGASAAEYALILAIVSLGLVAAAQLLGTNITAALNNAANTIGTAAAS